MKAALPTSLVRGVLLASSTGEQNRRRGGWCIGSAVSMVRGRGVWVCCAICSGPDDRVHLACICICELPSVCVSVYTELYYECVLKRVPTT